jgi:hypothetical protein
MMLRSTAGRVVLFFDVARYTSTVAEMAAALSSKIERHTDPGTTETAHAALRTVIDFDVVARPRPDRA